ncbi:MAG: FAD-binding oxidoreductase [Pseudomonadales bacterium]|nr:FAD-binding oxidoreductase [Pseudomonadales bacterium]
MKNFDVAVIGGGVVGLSAAYGLVKKNVSVAVLDEGDIAFRASRSNFGLVWFQGKGEDFHAYSRLSRQATRDWSLFANELEHDSGVRIDYNQAGGLSLCVGDAEAEKRRRQIDSLKKQWGEEGYECEFLPRSELEGLFKHLKLAHSVQTATYCPHDGQVNPLFLMSALHKSFVSSGGHYFSGNKVKNITPTSGSCFQLQTDKGMIECSRLLLAAGLGIKELGPKVGLDVPVYPNRGQILVTQRAEKLFPFPMNGFRQTEEGSVLLGYSNEDVGFNDQTSIQVTSQIAKKATEVFPQLANLRLVRTWAGLRILSPDNYPIYEQSKRYPGAYVATCHSGITLASLHRDVLPDWILSGEASCYFKQFGLGRFSV